MDIREYREADFDSVVRLWRECDLLRPWNDPARDIQRKLDDSPQQLFVGEEDGELIASCMTGYDGHRGWIYYLAVHPSRQRKGLARMMMEHAERSLAALGCPKIDLMVRESNAPVIEFYRRIGYSVDPVVVLSRRLVNDDIVQESQDPAGDVEVEG